MDEGPGFIDEVFKVFEVDFTADEEKVDLMGIFSPGKVAGDISFFYGSQVSEHLLDDLVEPYIFTKDVVDIGEEGMCRIGFKYLSVLFFAGDQQSCFFKAVELKPDGVGGFMEFRFQVPQIGFRVAVEEEPEQQLYSGFTGDKGV